jgi:hypothetical protein
MKLEYQLTANTLPSIMIAKSSCTLGNRTNALKTNGWKVAHKCAATRMALSASPKLSPKSRSYVKRSGTIVMDMIDDPPLLDDEAACLSTWKVLGYRRLRYSASSWTSSMAIRFYDISEIVSGIETMQNFTGSLPRPNDI